MRVVAILVSAILFYLIPDAVLETIFSTGFTACRNISQYIFNAVYNVPLVKTQMKKIIVTAKTLYSHPKNVSKIYAALHTDLAW